MQRECKLIGGLKRVLDTGKKPKQKRKRLTGLMKKHLQLVVNLIGYTINMITG